MKRTSPWIIVLIISMAVTVIAQPRPRAKRAGRPPSADPTSKQTPASNPTAAATPAPTPAQPAPSTNSPVLAVVDNVTITLMDIESTVLSAMGSDAELNAFYQDREKAIREARQRAVDARVSSMLINAEARKRGIPLEDFLAREVTGKTPPPTDAEVRAVYDANRAQFANTDLEAARPTIMNYLRNERGAKAYGDMVNRLKMTNTVQKGADVNAPNLAPGTVLASVNGQPIRIEMINERMKAYIHKLDRQIYQAQKQALDRRINDTLVLAEANKKNIGPEVIIRTEVTEKLTTPSETEIAKFYEDNKSQINGDLAATRGAIANYLQEQQQQKLEQDLAARLRAGAKIQTLLKEPVAPVFNVAVGRGISRGDINSPVKIVEFTDFQCSACGGMYPVIEEVLKAYGNRVYFEVRNFPLSAIHENAFQAAQAAAAAHAQGKFWPYVDLLYKNQKSLDPESLKKFATQAGLDRARFDADLASGKFDADIRRDIEEGEQYGIEGTPTIFINGVVLTSLSADALREAIDKGLARAGKTQ
ncbi:MAG TPA: thioredoxin domain-containing protein [Pyrinomonadaceae bacterium]|nr:thioredoxin domain-containing protein [Pyrinomonadaceae bacterium]